uniref:Uncharacterized protein n=1 Tax=Anopheles atroparvus TaxID=41427 RepID=A0AAG5DKE2_ANOAO
LHLQFGQCESSTESSRRVGSTSVKGQHFLEFFSPHLVSKQNAGQPCAALLQP